jgi:glycosyltransferase EpsD
MKQVLFVATVDIHILAFHLPFLKWFQARGWKTFVVTGDDGEIPYCDERYHIDIQRSPYSPKNLKALSQLKAILKREHFDIVHCHTPMGGVLARLAARKYRRKGTALLYTAHGFHFYRGGPVVSWIIYYSIERVLSRITDALITINHEDDQIAKRFHAGQTFLIPGVGFDEQRFRPCDPGERRRRRQDYGYAPEDILLIYAAELNRNKNQKLLIDVLKRVREDHQNVKLLLVGGDAIDGAWQRYAAETGMASHVDFLGQRQDVDQLMPICDIAVASSLREGLGINLLEAMACGLPVVATQNNGHRELISDGENGFLIPAGDSAAFAKRVNSLIEDQSLCEAIVAEGHKRTPHYSRAEAVCVMEEIYNRFR